MQKLIRRMAQPTLWWLYRQYNRRTHWVRANDFLLCIGPSVFHPRWFLTTRTFTTFAEQTVSTGKRVLELGAGNGLLALSCSRLGAQVTASDINPQAVDSIKRSATHNKIFVNAIHSDLFEQIPNHHFDYIFINPPFFPQAPKNDQEKAFLCGPNFEYFQQLFAQLTNYQSAEVYMILTNACDLDQITRIAQAQDFQFQLQQQTSRLGEEHYIYRVQGVSDGR